MEKGPTLGKRVLAEGLGVFLFVFLGAGSVIAAKYAMLGNVSILAIAIANGIGLALAIAFSMKISGGHINPVVTLAAWINGLIKGMDAIAYVIAQVAGALAAGLALVIAYPSAAGLAVHYGSPGLASGIGFWHGVLFEAIATFFLVLMVLSVEMNKNAPRLSGFGVGLVVVLDVLAIGNFTGAAMNPARAVGPMVASGFVANWPLYWIGPAIGAVVAALVYRLIR
ncbi:MAG: aquaporin [Candidatus Micrarchaeaceae archaeon]